MLIDELIEELEALRNKHGNLPVFFNNFEGYSKTPTPVYDRDNFDLGIRCISLSGY